MTPKELTAEQRRIAVDTIQLYEQLLELDEESRAFRGGMRWRTIAGRDYLVRRLDREGQDRSLGLRSPRTEQLQADFVARKRDLRENRKLISEQLRQRARFCVAAGVGRVPRLAADIIRSLDSSGLLGSHLIIIGSHAMYAYEMAAGLQLKAALLETADLDALLDAKSEIELAGSVRTAGLLGILQRVDRTFTARGKRSFRAANAKGFMVDLVRAPLDSISETGRGRLGTESDLVAEPLRGLEWLGVLPKMTQVVVADNGFPVRFIVPDPRVFALHKVWLSLQPTRGPIKRKRDFRQGEAVARLAVDYLNLSFDSPQIAALPQELRSAIPGMLDRMRERRSNAPGRESALPAGFGDVTVDDDE